MLQNRARAGYKLLRNAYPLVAVRKTNEMRNIANFMCRLTSKQNTHIIIITISQYYIQFIVELFIFVCIAL